MKIYRKLTGSFDVDNMLSDAAVIAKCQVQAPLVTIRHRRTMVLRSVAKKNCVILKQLLFAAMQAKCSWIKAVFGDLKAIAEVTPKLSECIDYSFSQWAKLLRDESTMKRIMQQACDNETWNAISVCKAPLTGTMERRLPCGECGQVFANMSALKSHMATRHSYVSPYRLRVDTPWCPCCLLYLHNLARVLKHLTTSATCGHNVMK